MAPFERSRPASLKQPPRPFQSLRRFEACRRRNELVGLGRLELPTSRLSSARSNQLSYKPQAPADPAAAFDRGEKPALPGTFAQTPQSCAAVQEERETKAAKSRLSGTLGR